MDIAQKKKVLYTLWDMLNYFTDVLLWTLLLYTGYKLASVMDVSDNVAFYWFLLASILLYTIYRLVRLLVDKPIETKKAKP